MLTISANSVYVSIHRRFLGVIVSRKRDKKPPPPPFC